MVRNMKIYKAYQFKMYPTKEQKNTLNSYLGTSRFIYNHFLSQKRYKEKNETYLLKDMKKDIVPLQAEYPWLKTVDSCILRTSLDDLDTAYESFFRGNGGYPNYKKKNNRKSYRTVCNRSTYKDKEYASIKVDLEKGTIKLPKLDEIEIRGYRNLKDFPYKILSATVKKEAGKYYVSVLVEEEVPMLKFEFNHIVGIDLGVKTLITCSDGTKYDKLEVEKYEKRLKGLQRALARSQKGSNNRKKIVEKIQRVYQKIRNARKYYIHTITKKLVLENDIIVAESLKVKEMIENKENHLAKHLTNASFSEFIRQLSYKAKWQNKKFYQINTYFASSQICSHCYHQEKKVKDLGVRKWECASCGYMNDRDLNASFNIMDEGINMYLEEVFNKKVTRII